MCGIFSQSGVQARQRHCFYLNSQYGLCFLCNQVITNLKIYVNIPQPTMTTSPTSNSLSQKFSTFSKNLDREKHLKHQQISKELQQLSTTLTSNITNGQQLYTELKDKVMGLREQVQGLETRKKDVERNVHEEMMRIQEEFRGEVEGEKIRCKDDIEEWTKYADEKLLGICHAMQDSTSQYEDNIEGISEKLGKKIANLQEALLLQKKKREDCVAQLTQSIESELARLYGQLQTSRKYRESTNKKISKMAIEIELKLQEELEEERKARKSTNKALLNLLEETCVKIQKAFY